MFSLETGDSRRIQKCFHRTCKSIPASGISSMKNWSCISMAILLLSLLQEEQVSVNGERINAKTALIPLGGLPMNSVVRITDRPDMTSAVYHERKAINQTKQTNKQTERVSHVTVYLKDLFSILRLF